MLPNEIMAVIEAVRNLGGRALLVGGAIRDMVLGSIRGAEIEPKDFDIEVYGLTVEELETVLAGFGPVNAVGKSFVVIKVTLNGVPVDVSLPRRDNKTGRGHKGFIVEPDTAMTPEEAASRRDFTMNALAANPLTGEVLDFFGGVSDLRRGVLRATDPEKFVEDPLRVLRGMQFCGRYELHPDDELVAICNTIAGSFGELKMERVWTEWWKWAAKSTVPSLGLEFLRKCGWIVHFPELAALAGCPQDPAWHPEGDVWQHTLHVADAAARIAQRNALTEDERGTLLIAALCHDLGKPEATVRNTDGRLASPGHAEAGAGIAQGFLRRIGAPAALTNRVSVLVREHLAHVSVGDEPTDRAVRRLAVRLGSVSIRELSQLVEADHSGRPPLPAGNPLHAIEQRAQELGVQDELPQPILMGRHLIILGMEPGRNMGALLRRAFEAQLDGAFQNTEEAMAWVQTAL